MPRLIEKLTGLGVCHIECGAQFSVALTSSGHVIFILNNLFRFLLVMPFFNCDVTYVVRAYLLKIQVYSWGKGDYFRLGKLKI